MKENFSKISQHYHKENTNSRRTTKKTRKKVFWSRKMKREWKETSSNRCFYCTQSQIHKKILLCILFIPLVVVLLAVYTQNTCISVSSIINNIQNHHRMYQSWEFTSRFSLLFFVVSIHSRARFLPSFSPSHSLTHSHEVNNPRAKEIIFELRWKNEKIRYVLAREFFNSCFLLIHIESSCKHSNDDDLCVCLSNLHSISSGLCLTIAK
jgi:hypothetical protein